MNGDEHDYNDDANILKYMHDRYAPFIIIIIILIIKQIDVHEYVGKISKCMTKNQNDT